LIESGFVGVVPLAAITSTVGFYHPFNLLVGEFMEIILKGIGMDSLNESPFDISRDKGFGTRLQVPFEVIGKLSMVWVSKGVNEAHQIE
jgi:hypothetical protein